MSAIAKNQVFTGVHTVGGLLPADMLVRIAEGKDVPGAKPADYDIPLGSVSDEAERHWAYLKGLWRELRAQLPGDADGTPSTDHANLALSRWVLPLFQELGFGKLPETQQGGIVADDDPERSFPITHRWQHVPVHVPTWATDLDRRPGGAGTVPSQSLVQETLNRTSAHLWAVLTNGRRLRLLRDSSALATASYIEFDLEAMFDGELFHEFVLLYRLLHASRFAVEPEQPPATCWLEKWRTEAITSGTRALEQLSGGVQEAITILGTGFLRHPANAALRANLDTRALHAALLRLVYRLLFLFVAEERGALHPPEADRRAVERYAAYFSSAKLRARSRRRRGTAHGDQYRALRLVLDALGGNGPDNANGRPELALPALGGLFTDIEADTPLKGMELSNEALLGAVRRLAQVRDTKSKRWRAVDYRNLDAEELGSIYESLLELVPRYSPADRSFALVELSGNDRKTTGSYYTPSSLIETLLDSSLDPVIDEAVKRGEEKAGGQGQGAAAEAVVAELLDLTVCDPACGSGHFLVAAARRIAKEVAAVREGNPEPTVGSVRAAMHEVVAGCIYGVDLNPMAVELAKVSLWLESLEPGKPLNFLDAHVKHGNALLGTTPKLLRDGIPDAAFKPIEGDDKKHARFLAKTNELERSGQLGLFEQGEATKLVSNTALAQKVQRITGVLGDSLEQVRRQERAYEELLSSQERVRTQRLADAWCAAFVWKKTEDAPGAVTQEVFRNLADAQGNGAPYSTVEEIERLRWQYRFFHWHLEFPDVFEVPENGLGVDEDTGWAGGFDCVLGNPPWERIKLQEQEFFAQRDKEIATAPNAAARKRLIAALKEDPERAPLSLEFEEAKRRSEGESHLLRMSGRYPLTGRGDINTYAVFSELDRTLTGPRGRTGIIVPTGIATDATTQHFFKDITLKRSLVSLFDFRNAGFFGDVAGAQGNRFCLLTLQARPNEEPVDMMFRISGLADLDVPDRRVVLRNEDVSLINPNTGTAPIFRYRRDAEITLSIYRRVPVLAGEGGAGENSWDIAFARMFDMANDSGLFHGRSGLERQEWKLEGNTFVKEGKIMLPLGEAKMMHHFTHRYGDYAMANVTEGKGVRQLPTPSPQKLDNPDFAVLPRYWVDSLEVERKLSAKEWKRGWMFGWRDITSGLDERTMINFVFPRVAAPDGTLLMLPGKQPFAGLLACLSSFVLDFVARQKVGGTHLKYFTVYQLPVLDPDRLKPHADFVTSRVRELAYTAWDMEPFARDLGDTGAPFRWDEERRAVIRAELDALFFHLYGINRADVDYIMETFPIVKKKDVAEYGSYRTKERILEIYDRMAEAGVSETNPLVDGENFTSDLTPPPGHGPRHAPA